MIAFRILTLAAVSSALSAAAFSQTSDAVPAWASQAVADLQKQGLLHGYPDGSLQGRRAATRYEMASLIYSVWKSVTGNVKDLGTGLPSKDLSNDDLKAQIESLKADIASLKGMGDDLGKLKKLLVEFEPELTQLGLDYELIRRQYNGLVPRVSWLEQHRLPVKLSGDLSFLMLGGDSGGGNFGFDTTGRPLGVGRGSQAGQSQNSTRDLTVLDEFALNLESADSSKTHWKGTLVTGNALGALGQGSTLSGKPYKESTASLYIQSLQVDWNHKGWVGAAGRIGYVGNPYLLRKPDTTPQYENARWDSPEWALDGAKTRIAVGPGSIAAYAGRTGALASVSGIQIQTLTFGRSTLPWQPGSSRPIGLAPGVQKVESLSGADYDLPLKSGALALNYEYLLGDASPALSGDNGRAYGGSLNLGDGPLRVEGGYAKTDLLGGGTTLVSRRNQAAWLGAKLRAKRSEVGLGYRYIEPLFGGAGDWGRIGMWWNPTDIKGFQADASTDFATDWRLYAKGGWHTGTGLQVNGQTGLGTDDHLSQYSVGLEHRFGEWKATASFEAVDWNLKDRVGFTGGQPTERWYGLGLRRESEHSLLSLNWLLSDIDSKDVTGFALGIGPKARGSLLAAQASLKF